ncbi:hypothetical protein [Streptomyces clavuligerus]|uniref:Cyclitol dehydrogenase n=1 Tax=Streptomyces clavuligerus TaxID=1901 RepID=B5GMF3_STRCL|nr:hypothetical protein [Streptomyces clavuligerus]ANW22368.1 dehydrogenase [Streptomyces clavuligerus]AXU17272.1 dehydrogenase [Streptomyces clavuligerus]EDY47499.1 hypothetical protein SSCG_00527 [Streptomyces clavuligerus]EFG04459.1 Cyclitol dehydrogenase [Streptomyces clavuligerus]MBY6307083.1 dehydrogenase [Streptomyces clavuligerus]
MSPEATRADLRILRAGVCGTDLQIHRRVRSDQARILGHEGVAEIRGEPGTPRRFALFNPVDPTDQERILGHSYDGIFQRTYSADSAPGEGPDLCPAAPELIADLAALTEPLATVLYGWDLVSAAGRIQTVAVWGAGTAGLLAALVAELHGCAVEVIHHRPARLEYVERRGLLHRSRLRGPRRGVPAADGLFDAAFLCLPREAAGAGLAEAVGAVRADGVIDLFGGFGPGDTHERLPGCDLGSIRRGNVCGHPAAGAVRDTRSDDGKPLRLTGHRGTSPAHLERAQRLLLQEPERFGALVTHVVSLDGLETCLATMSAASGPSTLLGEYIKVVVDPTLDHAFSRSPDLTTPLGALSEVTTAW